MARTWLQIRVELLGGGGIECKPPPGRDFILGPTHTFEQFARAIDTAFARWDRSHMHGFELADGRLVGYPGGDTPGEVSLDHAKLKVVREVKPGETFEYEFDFGCHWQHRCTASPRKVDPASVYGQIPAEPVAFWGWGSIPDQYGRRRP